MKDMGAVLVTLLVFVLLIAVPNHARGAEGCTTVWLTAPTVDHVLPAGTKRCIDPQDSIYDGQLIRIHRLDNPNLRQIDWLDSWAYTTQPPNDGRVQATADAIRWLGTKYDVRIQFAWRDLLDRRGCYGGFASSVSGASQPSPRHPGEGLVRIGTGTIDRCMEDRRSATNVAKHEISHVLIERTCGTMDPPRVTNGRIEEVTSAYGIKFLGAGMNDGGLVPTSSDYWHATKIHEGWCG